jgi:hypothetical protein
VKTRNSGKEIGDLSVSPPHNGDHHKTRLLLWTTKALNRNHWCIEGLHYVRDVTFDEDRCRIRKHAGARVMASLRNLAISLLRLAGETNIAEGLRACARDYQRPLRFLGFAS